MPNPNITHHTGQEMAFALPLESSVSNSVSVSYQLPYQHRVLACNWSADSSGSGTAMSVNIGSSNGASNIVAAVAVSALVTKQFTILDQVVDANQRVVAVVGASTSNASGGGALTFWVEMDQKGHLS